MSRQLLTKTTLEPGKPHVIGVYEAGFGMIIEQDITGYALFVVKGGSGPAGLLSSPVLVIEDGNIKLTATPEKTCLFSENGLLKIQNDRMMDKINVGYFFIPYKYV